MESLKQPHGMNMEGDLAQNWTTFKENFSQFLTATGGDAKLPVVQAAVLLHCMGQGARDVLTTLEIAVADKKDKDKIIAKLDEYFVPKKNTSIERHKFNTRMQMPGENFDGYLTDLRKIAANCNFGTLKDGLIADRIVCGIRKKK